MELYCPHCSHWFPVTDPFAFLGDQECPLCRRTIYVEQDYRDDGDPVFTAYKEMPQ